MRAGPVRAAAAAPAAILLLMAALPVLAQDARHAYFSRFDDDGDGWVSRAEYVAYMTRGFDEMDRDRNGRLDAHELPPGVRGRVRERAALERDLLAVFRRQDRDGDGRLSLAELTAPPR